MGERITTVERGQMRGVQGFVGLIEQDPRERIRGLLLHPGSVEFTADVLTRHLANLIGSRFDPRDKKIATRYFSREHMEVVGITGEFILSRKEMFTAEEQQRIAAQAKKLYGILPEFTEAKEETMVQRRCTLLDVVAELDKDSSHEWLVEQSLEANHMIFQLIASYYNR